MAGNVKGVIDVYTSGMKVAKAPEADAPAIVMETPAEAAEPTKQSVPVVADAPKVEYYVIQSGDSLSKIAKQYYGDAMQYPRIFEANKEVIEDPDKIYPGQKIRIPLD
ncbi:MAG: LysM peptidoglycan-binding domain-containing protein [Gammaproteobacteria bacterium]